MSYVAGSSGFWDSSPSAPAASSVIAFVIALSENEAGDEADQGEGLGECNAEEHGRTELTGQLGLTSGCFHVLGDDEAEADATTDRCEAVADGAVSAGGDFLRLGQNFKAHSVFRSLSSVHIRVSEVAV
jgi:hypothetical protein